MKSFFIFSFIIIPLILGSTSSEWNHKWSNEPSKNLKNLKSDFLTIHMIPHTHDDIGWLRTVDQYYIKQVRYILDTVMRALDENPQRKFTYVEQGFFQKWWVEQDEVMKQKVHKFVKNGQLEFNLGGWCMHDEAAPEYESMIMQMALGAQFIKDQFGVRPKVGWQIDPFGHTNQNGRIFADIGFDAVGLNRIDYRLKEIMKSKKTLEFIWKTSNTLGEEKNIFVHMMDNHYCEPDECDMGIWTVGVDSPDNKWIYNGNNSELFSYENNIERYVEDFLKMARTRAEYYNNGNHLLIPFGCDFSFENAHKHYKQMDLLIEYINQHKEKYNATVVYSHFSEYIKAIHDENKEWPVYEGDFMPYPSWSHAYWTGYFTSHPRLKGDSRHGMNILRTYESIYSTALLQNKLPNKQQEFASLLRLRKAQGDLQHHDAITGTEKLYVAEDYLKTFNLAVGISNKDQSEIISVLTDNKDIEFSTNLTETLLKLEKSNNNNNNNAIMVILYNNLAWKRNPTIRLIVNNENIHVYDGKNVEIKSQINKLPDYSIDRLNGTHELYFSIEIPPMGYNTVYLKKITNNNNNNQNMKRFGRNVPIFRNNNNKIENSIYTIHFNEYGFIQNITNKVNNINLKVDMNLLQYQSADGSDGQGQASGAYIFRPQPNTVATPVVTSQKVQNLEIIEGEIESEIRITYKSNYSQTVRLYKDGGDLSKIIENVIDLKPIDSGKELIIRYDTSVKNNKVLYADTNGLETQRREFVNTNAELIAGNYYPMTTRVYIENDNNNVRFATLTDRAHGVGSLEDGSLEIMLHRRCLKDDGYGVGEVLNETDSFDQLMWNMVGYKNEVSHDMKMYSTYLNHPPSLYFGITDENKLSNQNLRNNKNQQIAYSLLNSDLSPLVELTSIQSTTVDSKYIVVRFHHLYESIDLNEDDKKGVEIDLNRVFRDFVPKSITELALSGTFTVEEVEKERLQWKADNNKSVINNKKRIPLKGSVFTIQPMEIRTFELEL